MAPKLDRQESAKLEGGSELLNLLADVKSRVQNALGNVDFPTPQFLLIGKQSVGKSRLIETLAGEPFNFVSGALGSRRPTVLEFRNVPSYKESRWSVKAAGTTQWVEHPTEEVMKIVGKAHEELGESVSAIEIHCKIESANCMDMQIVDLPGFRDFSSGSSKQALANQIYELNFGYMRDPKNYMLCVEQAGDAANLSSLQKCREVDFDLKRTILIRNKLDKYYSDLDAANINKWVDGYGDLPDGLERFALTLPFWKEGQAPPKPFRVLAQEMNNKDVTTLQGKGLAQKYMPYIGFNNFSTKMSEKVETLFAESINPVLASLKEHYDKLDREAKALQTEEQDTNPNMVLATTRDCGVSFAEALTHVMEGVLELRPVQNLEDELKEFDQYHRMAGSTHYAHLPHDDFTELDEYVDYLHSDLQMPTFDVPVNGGAQYRRLLSEVEIFLRFSEMSTDIAKKDLIQARGVSMHKLTWREVMVKLLSTEHEPLQRRIRYVGERVRWFFEQQKRVVLNFMLELEKAPDASMFSPLFPKHARLIESNQMIQNLVFMTYDAACKRQYLQFVDLFDNIFTSTFANPYVFMKTTTTVTHDEEVCLPAFADTKVRVPGEMEERYGSEEVIESWLDEIPRQHDMVDEVADKVQGLLLRTYTFVRSQICDQVELFVESFFKLPMMRRLEEDMVAIEFSAEDLQNYATRRERLSGERSRADFAASELEDCIRKIQNFKIKVDAAKGKKQG